MISWYFLLSNCQREFGLFSDYAIIATCNGKKSNIFNVDFIFKGSDIYVHTYTCLNYVLAYVRENIFYAWQMKDYKTLVEKNEKCLKRLPK